MTQTTLFTEIGIGNPSFVSTEVEYGERERRIPGFMRMKVTSFYLRLWVGKTVFIWSKNGGFEKKTKPKSRFKLLLGLQGIPVRKKR